jgi:hypothetical protein
MCPERCSHDFTGRAMWCAVLIKAPWEKPAENSRAAAGGGLYSSDNRPRSLCGESSRSNSLRAFIAPTEKNASYRSMNPFGMSLRSTASTYRNEKEYRFQQRFRRDELIEAGAYARYLLYRRCCRKGRRRTRAWCSIAERAYLNQYQSGTCPDVGGSMSTHRLDKLFSPQSAAVGGGSPGHW